MIKPNSTKWKQIWISYKITKKNISFYFWFKISTKIGWEEADPESLFFGFLLGYRKENWLKELVDFWTVTQGLKTH